MTAPRKDLVAHWQGEAKKLEGATIERSFYDLKGSDWGGPQYWITFHLRLPDGRLVEVKVSQDDEGNGPGSLFTPEFIGGGCLPHL